MRGRVGRLGAWVGMPDRRRKFGGTGEHNPKKHSRPTAAKLLCIRKLRGCPVSPSDDGVECRAEWTDTNLPQRGPVSGIQLLKRLASASEPQRYSTNRPISGTLRLDRASAMKSPFENPEDRA